MKRTAALRSLMSAFIAPGVHVQAKGKAITLPPNTVRPGEPIHVTINGSSIGGSPFGIADRLARIVKPHLDGMGRKP